jgi:Tol biopolymer transport system component
LSIRHKPRFSPDGKWIVFLAQRAKTPDVMVAPFRGAETIPEKDWITVTAGVANTQAFWSPDGNLLYLATNAVNSYSIMAQRLDRNHHPAGVPSVFTSLPASWTLGAGVFLSPQYAAGSLVSRRKPASTSG